MPNIQQPEMRRSGRDPLVTDSVKDKEKTRGAAPGHGRDPHPVPESQRSPYGPRSARSGGE
ncbi:MAG TPA: hypothetical protein VFY17_09575 [Pilimelia sp.]|nr:hypothetical protein [Pilimelia sp.]